MARRSSSIKKWVLSAAMVGGVATGVVTAAGASTSDGVVHANPTAAEAQQLHDQVLSLTHQEESLTSTLLARHQRSASESPTSTTTGAPSSETVTTEGAKPAGSNAPVEPASPATGGTSTAPPVKDTDGPPTAGTGSEPTTEPTESTEPPESTTTTPTTGPVTTTSTTAQGHDGGRDGGGPGGD
jgi:hypothetical protein